MGSITFIYEEARNFYGVEQYVSRLSTQLMTTATSAAATTLAGQVLALGNATAVFSAAPANSIIGAFSYNQHNLHPFDQLAVSRTSSTSSLRVLRVSGYRLDDSGNSLPHHCEPIKLVLSSCADGCSSPFSSR